MFPGLAWRLRLRLRRPKSAHRWSTFTSPFDPPGGLRAPRRTTTATDQSAGGPTRNAQFSSERRTTQTVAPCSALRATKDRPRHVKAVPGHRTPYYGSGFEALRLRSGQAVVFTSVLSVLSVANVVAVFSVMEKGGSGA